VFRDDQWCTSIDGKVGASLSKPTTWDCGTTTPAEARVYASKDVDVAAVVTLCDPHDRALDLTPHEARDLARQLLHFAWVAEQ